MRIARRVVLILVVLAALYPATVLGIFFLAPDHNARFTNADVIIVLGCPPSPDGTPTPELRERVLEGVREYKKGVSHKMIMTGAAVKNQFAEGRVMAELAEQNGVPASDIVEETQARDTIQNIYYSDQIMRQRGWRTAEVVSASFHLPRTALILHHFPEIEWRTHSAPWPPNYTLEDKVKRDWDEAQYSFKLRIFGFKSTKFLPN